MTLKKKTCPSPKKIHFIWLGPKQPSYLKKFMKTFKTYAPGYTLRLWGEKDITSKTLPITYPYIKKIQKLHSTKIKEYSKQKTMYKSDSNPYTYSKFAQISDLMRYEIVFNEGGYYFDANMFLMKDIIKLFNRKEKFVGCNELGRNLSESEILSNSFFGAIPSSPILKRLLSKSFLDSLELQSLDVDFVTGPGALRNAINLTKDDYYIFPPNTFYPYILPWTPDGGDHYLRKSSKPKCTGPKKTKKRTLKMKPNLWLEFPCKKYKGVYGIKIWESGGSWSRPSKWYEKDGSKFRSLYAGGTSVNSGKSQKGGSPVVAAATCVPCMAASAGTIASSTLAATSSLAGACAYGVHKAYKCIKTKKKHSKKKKKKKSTKNKK
jgi:hypothetical protein